jgi:hypothetical protein
MTLRKFVLTAVLLGVIILVAAGGSSASASENFKDCQPMVPPGGKNYAPVQQWTCIRQGSMGEQGVPMRVNPTSSVIECAALNNNCMKFSYDACSAWSSLNNQIANGTSPYTIASDISSLTATKQCTACAPDDICAVAKTVFTNAGTPAYQSTVPN